MSDRGHFLNINTLHRILFSQLTCFGKLSFFNFGPSFLSPDAFRSIGCIGCKLIFLADVPLAKSPLTLPDTVGTNELSGAMGRKLQEKIQA